MFALYRDGGYLSREVRGPWLRHSRPRRRRARSPLREWRRFEL